VAINRIEVILVHISHDWLIGWWRPGPRHRVDRAELVFGWLQCMETTCTHACNIELFLLACLQEQKRRRAVFPAVGSMLRRRRSSRKKRLSAEAVCMRWPKVPFHEASVLQTDLKIE
jgi:hypothetical protein